MIDLLNTYVEPRRWLGTLHFATHSWGPKNSLISLAQAMQFPILPASDIEETIPYISLDRPPVLLPQGPTTNQRYELALELGQFPLLLQFIQEVRKLTEEAHTYELTSEIITPGEPAFKLIIKVTEDVICQLIRAKWQPTYDNKDVMAGWVVE
jgi:hypothetical protein